MTCLAILQLGLEASLYGPDSIIRPTGDWESCDQRHRLQDNADCKYPTAKHPT